MNNKAVLLIKNKTEVLYLPWDSILYIQADGNYCDVFLADGDVINTLTYQRAEIARMMDEQFPEKIRRKFLMLGRFYLVNSEYVLRIQPNKFLLTFSINSFGTTRKVCITATTKSLNTLIKQLEWIPESEE